MSAHEPLFNDRRFWPRLGVMLLAGLVMAGLLTAFMYSLIQLGEQQLGERDRAYIVDFVRVQRDERTDRREPRPERVETPDAPPMPRADISPGAVDSAALAVSSMAPDLSRGVDVSGFGAGAGDGEILPIVRVAPVYPPDLARRGIEGICRVEYTVTTSGTTRDVRVVPGECTHPAFERPSIAAAERFRFRPRIVGGEPVEVQGVRNTFVFSTVEE